VDKKTAIAAAEAALDCTYNSHPTTLEYLARPDGSVALVHVIQVKNDHTGRWYEAYVDAHSAQLLSTVDFVADASVS
jgi:extracellular elastinolytic metalloproteinase